MFSKYEQRGFFKIQIARGKNVRQCHTALRKLVIETLSYCTVARWAYAIRRGREDVHKKRGAGRPQSASDDVHENAVRELLEEHRCRSCSVKLAREVGIAPGTILHILRKKIKMRKICSRWVPHNLKEENIWQRMETARLHL